MYKIYTRIPLSVASLSLETSCRNGIRIRRAGRRWKGDPNLVSEDVCLIFIRFRCFQTIKKWHLRLFMFMWFISQKIRIRIWNTKFDKLSQYNDGLRITHLNLFYWPGYGRPVFLLSLEPRFISFTTISFRNWIITNSCPNPDVRAVK